MPRARGEATVRAMVRMVLVIAVLGAFWALSLRHRRPTVYAAIGLGAKSATALRATDDAADVPARPDFEWTEEHR